MKTVAKIYNDDSTWFKGFDEKFFFYLWKLAKALFLKMYIFYIEYFIRRYPEKLVNVDIRRARQIMLEGAKDFGG